MTPHPKCCLLSIVLNVWFSLIYLVVYFVISETEIVAIKLRVQTQLQGGLHHMVLADLHRDGMLVSDNKQTITVY